MLQSSNYSLRDYFSWLLRVDDFRRVMKRGGLDYTNKARLLLLMAWVIMLFIIIISILSALLFIGLSSSVGLLFSLVLFLAAPILMSYIIALPLWLGWVLIQKPKQYSIVNNAKKIISIHPALKIAIAGSYGKTTAKEIISTVLSEGKKVAYTPGNMNTPIGISRFAKKLGECDVVIFELGEEKVGDVKELCDLVQPDMGIITGINEAHLSSFKTLDNTVSTIFELEDYLGEGTLYKNRESRLVTNRIKNKDKLVFDQKGVNGWRTSDVKIDIYGTSFIAQKGDKKIVARTGLLGLHNIGIILVAIDIADTIGLTIEQIESGISKTIPFEHRMQPRNIHGAWVIDDTYNGNSDGVRAGLLLLKDLRAKRKVYITPGLVEQGDKTREVHEKIGQQIADVADVAVLMNNSVTDYIKNGLEKANYKGKLIIVDDPLEFYSNIDQFVAGGDLVLMQNDWTDNYA
jgi:UDP-N-acetylmuramoyl-tripeptide--D-alanyl-D-alanine ligase